MAARPISYNGQPPGQPPRPGVYPGQAIPQPLYRPIQQQQQQQQYRPIQQQQQQYIPQQQLQQQHIRPFGTPTQQFISQHNPYQQHAPSPRPQFIQRPNLMVAPSVSSIPQQSMQAQLRPAPIPYNPNHNIVPISSAALPAGQVIPGVSYGLRTPSLSAAPSIPIAGGNLNLRPIMVRPQSAYTVGPPTTVVSSPGLARVSVPLAGPIAGPLRPVLIAAGPPSIIKNPTRTKLLLERNVPVINIKQKNNTLLSNFWGDDIDINRDGRVIDRSTIKSPNGESKRPKQTGIVVGIDFGNTFTGVSYAHQGDGEMIDVVKWPRHLNAYAKVPTVSLYKTNENKGLVDWGSSALASYKRSKIDRVLVKDYKLLLFDQGARGKLSNGLHLTDVFTQYLQGIYRHLMEEVNKSQVLAAESVPIHYCITIPQSWTLPTRELVLRCYVEAGIILQTPAPNMTVITEAEAAATYCREKCEEFEQLKDGDTFMICDAGGLTATVTAFRVDDGLGVRQFVRMSSSHSENCGSVMLDRKFRDLVMSKLQGLEIDEDTKPSRQKAFETLLEGFNEIKSQFDGNSADEVKHIPVPMGLDVKELQPTPQWLEDEYMALKGKELCDIVFDPVVEMIQDLINMQSKVHPVCSGLFMVGGFGANKYLLHKLTLEAEKSSGDANRISASMSDLRLNGDHKSSSVFTGVIKKVVMVQKAELAVARGAVVYGLKSASQYTKAFLLPQS
ncbi:hypothetical protein BGZ76_002611 [Entomortierella beljakovae]|nr:hypothetical protein BGZ76_002611 [Entomortierella beljakovae]